MSALIKALVAARKEIGSAKKGSVNPHFRSKYADLASVIEAVKEPLENHGLTFVQDCRHATDVGWLVCTVIYHESGEKLELAYVPVLATKPDAQGWASGNTYARRYSLQMALGVPAEDDDGNAASKPSAVISPVKEALKGTAVDMELARKIASSLVDLYADDASSDADYQAWELIEPMDSDLKLAVWDILQPHSKVRSWLKKVGDEHRAKA